MAQLKNVSAASAKKICIVPNAGLCNRLRVLFSWLRVAEQTDCELDVFWVEDHFCNGKFLDYFEEIDRVNFVEERPEKIDYEGYGTHPDVRHTASIYEKLIPKREILEELEEICSRHERYNSMHIRRTDHVRIANEDSCFVPDDVFYKFAIESKLPVYLSCDNRDTQEKFMGYFDNVFVHKMIEKSNETRQTSLKDAIVDIFACVDGEEFQGTYYSSFSDIIYVLKKIYV